MFDSCLKSPKNGELQRDPSVPTIKKATRRRNSNYNVMDESVNDFENYVCFRNMENDSIRKIHNNSADSPSKRNIQKVSCGTGCAPF